MKATQIFSNQGTIGKVRGRGGVAGGEGILEMYIQSEDKTESIEGLSNANGGHAIAELTANIGSLGNIKATVLGGEGGEVNQPISSGVVGSTVTALQGGIGRISVNVKSIQGEGISNCVIDSSDTIESINVISLNSNGINGTSIIATNRIGAILANSLNGGTAIMDSQFTSKKAGIADGSNIQAVSGGGGSSDHGIGDGTVITAYGSIGRIDASTSGGSGISGVELMADSGYRGIGRIEGIRASTSGINLQLSTAISNLVAEASGIGSVKADVSEYRGGAAITGSVFTARNAKEDDAGIIRGRERLAFNNAGSIGKLTIRNASRTGNGLEFSQLIGGGSGKIGNIDIDMLWQKSSMGAGENRQASGTAIYGSSIRATGLDPDQNIFNGRIGDITISTGRVIPDATIPPIPPVPPIPPIPQILFPPPNDQFTEAPAGINLSYLAAYGGVGAITVRAVGTGVGNSIIDARSDLLNPDITRNLSVAKVKPHGKVKKLDIAGVGLFAEDVINTTIHPTPAPQ